MKKKLALLLSLTLIIGTLGISPVFSVSGQCPVSKFKVEPAATTWPSDRLGETFSIDVLAYDLVDFAAYSVGISYNPDVLEYTGYTWGEMENYVTLHTMLGKVPGEIDPDTGATTTAWMQAADTNLCIETLASLKLITFHFKVGGYGTSDLTLMSDPFSTTGNVEGETYRAPTDFTLEHGTFTITSPAPYGPTAIFDYTPKVITGGVTNVAFDASASKPGFDGTELKDITEYTWDFGDGTVVTESDPITWHIFPEVTATTVYSVTLTVTAPGATPETDSTTQDVSVYAPAPPSGVDVFTIKEWLGRTTLYRERGKDPGVPGSAFGPGETVTLRGYVYYEDIPMMAVNVGFQVNDPDVLPYTSRTASTDVDGNATISFRLPLQPKLGSYGVVATARVFETDMSDTLDFNVGWLIKILVDAPDAVERGTEGTFTVTVTNIDPHDAYPVLITISVSDKIGVVLNATSIDIMAAPGTAPEPLSVDIPTTAIPGPGAEVEANAYTDWPAAGGTAYCPPATDTFEIT